MGEEKILFKEIDVVRNFEFPISTIDIALTANKKRLLAVGNYKPSVKAYDFANISTRFERHLIAEPIRIVPLSEDVEKFAILRVDRTIEFHTKTGFHTAVHIPHSGRDIIYNSNSAELFISGNFDGIYRFNTEQGRFLKTIETERIHRLAISNAHGLIGGISSDKICFIDPRSKTDKFYISVIEDDLLCIDFNDNGLNFSVGTKNGFIYEYDLRSNESINSFHFEGSVEHLKYAEKYLISSTGKNLNLLSEDKRTNCIDFGHQINCFAVDGSVVLVGGETERLKSFYIPEFGQVPSWCPQIAIE